MDFNRGYLPKDSGLFKILSMEHTQHFQTILNILEIKPCIFFNCFEYPIFTWDVFQGKKTTTIILFTMIYILSDRSHYAF